MAEYKDQHTLARRHMRLFACCACEAPRCKFIWQNDRAGGISRRVPLDSQEKQAWIHDPETEGWITNLETVVLDVYDQIRNKKDPITLSGYISNGDPLSIDVRVPLWNYVSSIITRRSMKEIWDKQIVTWNTDTFINRIAWKRCLYKYETWPDATFAVRCIAARMIEQAAKMRGMVEQHLLDGEDCPFGELFLLQTEESVVLPDLGFCQRGRMVFMPVSPQDVFVAIIGTLRGEFTWPRRDFPVVKEAQIKIDDGAPIDAAMINDTWTEQASSAFSYSRSPLFPIEKDCCPRNSQWAEVCRYRRHSPYGPSRMGSSQSEGSAREE
jgi:hypothetical protein